MTKITIGGVEMKKLGKGKSGSMKALVKRHLGDKAAEKITKSDGAKLMSKAKKSGNTKLFKKGSFIKNMMREKYEAAITDIDINTRHRNETIEKNGYGPANPDQPGDFWKKKAELWDVSEDIAKSMKCGNCSAFDKSPKTLKKIADAIGPDGHKVVEQGDLGYCELFEFKCAGTRTCDAWVHGGPITEAYDVGHDYADHTNRITPGQKNYDPKYQGKKYKPAKPGSGKRVVEMEENKNMSKTRMLARSGMIPKKDLTRFEAIMRKMEKSGGDSSKLSTVERNFLASIYDDLLSAVVNDPNIFNRMRRKVKESIDEKKLTPAEKKKREEVAQAIARDNPDMPMDKKMAIATATAKRVAEDSHSDGSYSKKKLKMAADAAMELDGMLGDSDDLPEWVQGKITKACDYLDSARDYIKNMGDDGKGPVGESAQAWKKWAKTPAGKRYAALSAKEKEAKAERNRNEDIVRHADVKMIKTKTPDGKTIFRKQRKEVDIERDTEKTEMYKSPAHARLQKHMDKIRKTKSYQNQVRKLGGTPLKPGEQNPMKRTTNEDMCCDDCNDHFDHVIEESMYQGKKVKLNDPIRTNEVPTKKFKVYVRDGDKIKVVRFGDPNLSIKRDDPERRKSFRARHNCDNPGPKTKPRYWSCYQWRSGAKVDN